MTRLDILAALRALEALPLAREGGRLLLPEETPEEVFQAIRPHKARLLRALEDGEEVPARALLEDPRRRALLLLPEEGGKGVSLTRDPDPSGCPTHWQRVPELPPRGSRVAMVDEAGLGRLYRFKVKGVWYLLKFLPPFDGRVSLTDQQGRVRVLASLDEATGFLALVTEDEEDVLVI
jgi:hypothetical protein